MKRQLLRSWNIKSIKRDLWTWIELVGFLGFFLAAMQSQKIMYALLNKNMRFMWPVCCSNSSSQTHKIPNCTVPSPNSLLKLAEPRVCVLCQGSQTSSSSSKGPYQLFCMFRHVAEHLATHYTKFKPHDGSVWLNKVRLIKHKLLERSNLAFLVTVTVYHVELWWAEIHSLQCCFMLLLFK